MPKGKARKANPGMYQDSTESQPRSMAPQAVAHRRGGTHRVRDGDRTDSVYDSYNYKELVDATKERNLYRKDMKKVEMAKSLRDDDFEKRRAERHGIFEREKKQQQEKILKQKRDAERLAAREADRERRLKKREGRARHEIVSDDTLSEGAMEEEHRGIVGLDEYARETIGEVVSDESWDSTSSDSTIRSVNQPIVHDNKLRLFEWPYPDMPVLDSRPSSSTLLGQQTETVVPERLPWQIPYSPLKVITTETKQKLFLPGHKYPVGVDLDYVPVLSSQTITAARNGVLEGVLRKATIERAAYWAERTQVQGWNARMYFKLPARTEGKDLAEIYNKWNLENRKLLRVKGRGDGVPAHRQRRRAQRHINKGKKTVEVYEASKYRPLAVCYIPSYLGFNSSLRGAEQEHIEEHRSLANLFFIRFPGCDLPHYYFWTRVGEWEDPAKPNTRWDPTKVHAESMAASVGYGNDDEQETPRQSIQGQSCKTCEPLDIYWKQLKKPDIMRNVSSISCEPTELAGTLAKIERELHSDGLATTMRRYRMKWVANGKSNAWNIFAGSLPSLYPNGQMPAAPPVDARSGALVAMKLAMIDTLGVDEKTPLSPIRGDESWTRNDGRFWDAVKADEVAVAKTVDENLSGELERCEDALYRRSSTVFPKGHTDWVSWLDQVSPSYGLHTPMSLCNTLEENVGFEERAEWEESRSGLIGHDISPTCPFCSMRWKLMSSRAKTLHMWSHGDSEDVPPHRPSTAQTLGDSPSSEAHADEDLPRQQTNEIRGTAHATCYDSPRFRTLLSQNQLPARQGKRERVFDPTLRDALSSPRSSIEEFSNTKKRKKIATSVRRKRQVALSVPSFDVRPMKRRRWKVRGIAEATASVAVLDHISSADMAKLGYASMKKKRADTEDLDIKWAAKRLEIVSSQRGGARGSCVAM
ncbi:Nn.00g033570.m01.CDS01 [Neocucurbitaria sp. VM-36]